jgi:hypothetical protein
MNLQRRLAAEGMHILFKKMAIGARLFSRQYYEQLMLVARSGKQHAILTYLRVHYLTMCTGR